MPRKRGSSTVPDTDTQPGASPSELVSSLDSPRLDLRSTLDSPRLDLRSKESRVRPSIGVGCKFILRGVEWLTSFIPKTETATHSALEGRECVANNIYIKIGESFRSESAKKCYWCRLLLPQNDEGVYQVKKLPLKELSKRNTFLAQGQFCSRECIKAFCIDNHLKQPDVYSKALAVLETQHRRETGSNEPLKSAPPWQFLDEYGGKWTEEQYRTNAMLGYTYTKNTSQHTNKLVEIPVSAYYREYS